MGLRYNPPPGWPPPPPGFNPRPGWQPDPSWGPPPPGWQLWVNDDEPPAQDWPRQSAPSQPSPAQDWASQSPPQQDWASQPPPQQDWASQPPPQQDWASQGPSAGWAAEPAQGGRGSRRAAGGGTSGWAVTSFILGIVAVIPLSVIFGFVALQRIRRLGQRGRGLAIAGLVLSVVWAGVFVLVGVTNAGSATRQSSTGKITHRGDLGVFALAVGDCFDNPTNTQDIESVTAIPCTQAHDSQVFAKFDLSGADSDYPTQQAMTQQADSGCNARTSDIDKTKTTANMDIRVLFPEQDAWADGQRTVSCLVVSSAANVTSSLLKS